MGKPPLPAFRRRCPSPHGEGGLKYALIDADGVGPKSLPSRGGWIEIWEYPLLIGAMTSLPSRGGWIEIQVGESLKSAKVVPPLTGRVD